MAEFLSAVAVSFYIEKLIKEAGEGIDILFPYLQINRDLYEALKDASDRGVIISVVYSTEDLQMEEKLKLGELANLEVFRSEKLNTKCILNEKNVLFTSMDIHHLAPQDSIDMGILLDRVSEEEAYRNACNEIRSVINNSVNMNLHKKASGTPRRPASEVKRIYHGFCINCAMPINFNTAKPYCRSCITKGLTVDTGSIKGEFCHLCGQSAGSDRNSPLCVNCKSENPGI